ncbi:hypothetical protein GCM10027199_35940 [Amycolatopsis magusensis]
MYEVPGWSGSGWYSFSKSQPRSAGKPDTASVPSTAKRHRSSGVPMPPGKRQAMPTMTIGSSVTGGSVRSGTPASASAPSNSSRR